MSAIFSNSRSQIKDEFFMLRKLFLFLLAGAASLLAQSPASTNASAAASNKPPVAVVPSPEQLPDSTVVISIRGVCGNNTGTAGSECVTNITKQQFQTMLAALGNPQQMMSNPVAMRTFAQSYAEALAVAQAAEKEGADKDPQFVELMRIARVRTLSDNYRRRLQQQYSSPTPESIELFYRDNQARYEQVELDRIVIPRSNSRLPKEAQPQFEASAKKIVEDVHTRAARGEDPGALQIEAYKQLGLKPPLTTDLGLKKKGSLPSPLQEEVFGLKAGEVTAIHSDPGSYTTYKVRTHTTISLERVKEEIAQELERKNLEAAMQKITGDVHTQLNENFFVSRQPAKATLAPGRMAGAQPKTEPGAGSPK
jgi:hypothetical protein